jgi:XapX domain-containing protein
VKIYLLSLGAGLLAGILYGVLNVRSPAPPVVALVGLLGILLGEQVPPLVRQWLAPKSPQVSWLHEQVKPHCFGKLPCAASKEDKQ